MGRPRLVHSGGMVAGWTGYGVRMVFDWFCQIGQKLKVQIYPSIILEINFNSNIGSGKVSSLPICPE